MIRIHTLKLLGGLALVAAGQAYADQTVAYDVQKLPVSGASITKALGINKTGQVVGMAQIAAASHAVVWTQGVATDLGAGQANAINANARVAGSSIDANGREYATVWTNQTPTLLGDGAAYAINDQDDVAGEALGVDGVRHPAVWRQGAVTLLSTQAGRATGINQSGQIVGYVTSTVNGTTTYAAIKWIQGVPTVLSVNAIASGINDAGLVVGNTFGDPDNRIYWTADNQPHPLTQFNQPAGALTAINNIGQVVGTLYGTGVVLSLPDSTSFVRDSSFMRYAGDTGYSGGDWINVYPQGISDSGTVAASYCNYAVSANGNTPVCSAVMFKPVPAPCIVGYSLSTISSFAFSEDISLTILTPSIVTVGWQVTETLKNATLVYKVSAGAKVNVSGGGVNIVASPSSAAQTMTFYPEQPVKVSFSGAKLASTVPTVTSLSATVGGQACIPAAH